MQETKSSFLKIKKKYLSFIKRNQRTGSPFYDSLKQLKNYYIPIGNLIYKTHQSKKKSIVIGISGAQGTGKTTISKIIEIVLRYKYNLKTVSFSIDDFYKTRKERSIMSKRKHKLFLTRGVPGTHEVPLMRKVIKKLLKNKFKPVFIPRFDKSIDDRLKKTKWKKISQKPQIILFEGWCVSAKHQKENQLAKAVNKLEKIDDKNLIWRREVNKELKNQYRSVFSLIDKKIFLKVPNFKYVYKWRLLQEKKLKKNSRGKKIMNKYEIKNFIMHYERITRHMIKEFNKNYNVVITIDKKHKINGIKFF